MGISPGSPTHSVHLAERNPKQPAPQFAHCLVCGGSPARRRAGRRARRKERRLVRPWFYSGIVPDESPGICVRRDT